ncbi:MAG: DUF4129 domain-containing protein [Caulobacterales bacterium]
MAAQSGIFSPDAAPSAAALRAAHARLLADKSLQFHFDAATPPRPPSHLPHWLQVLGRMLGHLVSPVAGLMVYVFWAGVAAAVCAVLFFIGREILRTRWPELFKPKAPPRPAPVDWRPDPGAARALLEEADSLAAAGRYAEAAHVLLHRSIADIEGHRPRLVRPALTSRDIAVHQDLPPPARTAFSTIAAVVERSFFGGRDVDAGGFAECRRAYEAFAFPGAWA